MRMLPHYLSPAILLLAIPATAAPRIAAASDWNPTRFILVFIALALVFANGLLACVLRQLGSALLDKKRRSDGGGIAAKGAALLTGILMFSAKAIAQNDAESAPAALSNPFISGIPAAEFWLLSGLIGFLMLCLLVLVLLVRMLLRGLREDPAAAAVAHAVLKRSYLDVFNRSVALEEESEILLDHDYDGIRELDNDLPPWWKWGFVATVISAFMYMGYYHAWGGPSQAEEYEISVRRAEVAKAAYLAKAGDQVDESNVTLILDGGQLAQAKELFSNVCAACHRADGGGAVGPNLTDDYWLHGGSLQDVFKSIKYGWRDKGMPPWNGNLSAKQIAGIASYVKSLKGTAPAVAKAPQGDLFVAGNDKAIDSLSNRTEPSLTPAGTTENKDNPVGPYRNKADGKGAGTAPER